MHSQLLRLSLELCRNFPETGNQSKKTQNVIKLAPKYFYHAENLKIIVTLAQGVRPCRKNDIILL